MYVLHVHVCCLWSTEGGVVSLELGLKVVVSHQVGVGNQTGYLCKSGNCY